MSYIIVSVFQKNRSVYKHNMIVIKIKTKFSYIFPYYKSIHIRKGPEFNIMKIFNRSLCKLKPVNKQSQDVIARSGTII
jgi:hypothetical protein